ncbi:MAG: hypothetical protein AAFY36_17730 [Bacteroidota bacterium]
MNQLYAAYDPPRIKADITFIRSSEFAMKARKEGQINDWKSLTEGRFQLHQIEGTHVGLFSEPEVEGLAQQINQLLV